MDGDACRFCGAVNRPGSRYCAGCGRGLSTVPPSAPLGPRYSALRFQVDPLLPPPRRDIRWILIVLGVAFIVVAVLLLAIAAIVSSAVCLGSTGCRLSSCPLVDPGVWLDWLGLPFLVIGILLLAAGLWWSFR